MVLLPIVICFLDDVLDEDGLRKLSLLLPCGLDCFFDHLITVYLLFYTQQLVEKGFNFSSFIPNWLHIQVVLD